MAIVALTGTGRSPFTLSTTQRQMEVASVGTSILCTTVEVGAADSDTSTYHMARLPAAVRLMPQSAVGLDDLASAGSPTLDIGTFNVADGTADDDDAINDGLDAAAASGYTAMIKDVADWGQPLWAIAGASSDPGGFIDIYVTLQDADVNVGGTVSASFVYTVD